MYPVGSTVPNSAQAYTNTDPFVSPSFDAAGVLEPGTATESAADGATTGVSALDITKSEPSPEGELLRGVHDHPTVYTLRVRATDAGGTDGVVVTDYLPAESSSSAAVARTSRPARSTPAPRSWTPPPPCRAASPPTPSTRWSTHLRMPARPSRPGVYTRLRWVLGDLAAGQQVVLPYAAGVPLRANAAWPAGAAPDPATGRQGSNLDNNSGGSTREGPSERSATNRVTATGDYQGPLAPGAVPAVTSTTSATVTIEDLRMRKSVSPSAFRAGGIARYTLVIDASEYTSASDVLITDAVPSGLCPLGAAGTNYAPGSPPECDGAAGTTPTVPFDTVTSNPDGGFTVQFDPVAVGADGSLTITYAARMLAVYLGGPSTGEPTAVGDSFTNRVSLAGDDHADPADG